MGRNGTKEGSFLWVSYLSHKCICISSENTLVGGTGELSYRCSGGRKDHCCPCGGDRHCWFFYCLFYKSLFRYSSRLTMHVTNMPELGFALVGLSNFWNLLQFHSWAPNPLQLIIYDKGLILSHTLFYYIKGTTDLIWWLLPNQRSVYTVDYLYAHQSEAEGGSFKKQMYQGAVSHIQSLCKQGGPKDVASVKEKFTKAIHFTYHMIMIWDSSFL